MPVLVLLERAGARTKRFRKREIGRPVEPGVSGKHDCGTREEFRVTELSPESGIWREVRAEPDKGLFRFPIRGHPLEPNSPKFESGRGRHQQFDKRIPTLQAMKDSIRLRSPTQHAQRRQPVKFPLQRRKGKPCSARELAKMNARIRPRTQRLEQTASGGADKHVKRVSELTHVAYCIKSRYIMLIGLISMS